MHSKYIIAATGLHGHTVAICFGLELLCFLAISLSWMMLEADRNYRPKPTAGLRAKITGITAIVMKITFYKIPLTTEEAEITIIQDDNNCDNITI